MGMGLGITFAIFGAVTYLLADLDYGNGQKLGFASAWFPGMLAAFTYWGWKFLSENQRLLFIGNINFWLGYVLVKFFFAYFIGIIVGPYKLYKMIKEVTVASKTNLQIARGRV